MKKVAIIIFLGLTLISCGVEKNEIEKSEVKKNEVEKNNLNNNQEKNMSKKVIEKGSNVSVHYTGTLEDGTTFDSSLDREPLSFKAGAGQMIAGFDAGVIGMKVGEKKKIEIEPKNAYGEYDETKKQVIPKKDLESFISAGYELKVGEKLKNRSGEFEITESSDDSITIDTNHVLAGKKLFFDVEIIEIK